jgi:hypothetical protein
VGKTGFDIPLKAMLFGDPSLAQPTLRFCAVSSSRGTSKTGKLAENRRFFDKLKAGVYGTPAFFVLIREFAATAKESFHRYCVMLSPAHCLTYSFLKNLFAPHFDSMLYNA